MAEAREESKSVVEDREAGEKILYDVLWPYAWPETVTSLVRRRNV